MLFSGRRPLFAAVGPRPRPPGPPSASARPPKRWRCKGRCRGPAPLAVSGGDAVEEGGAGH